MPEISWIPIAVLIFFLAGLLKGFNGFGFALLGVSLLSMVLKPVEAVSILILPLIGSEIDLITDLSSKEVKECFSSFYPYIGAACIGTILGVISIGFVPIEIMKGFIGAITVLFVVNSLKSIEHSVGKMKTKCFRRGYRFQLLLGLFSGFFFGASNIAVQVVEYLETLDISERKFKGLLAMIMIGLSLVRIPLSVHLGYFKGDVSVLLSALMVFPAVIGVSIGDRIEKKVDGNALKQVSLAILILIGLKLFISPF